MLFIHRFPRKLDDFLLLFDWNDSVDHNIGNHSTSETKGGGRDSCCQSSYNGNKEIVSF